MASACSGRAVEPRDRQVGQLERVERQLAADGDQRPAAAHPAAILDRAGFDQRLALRHRDRLVHDRIEDADDLALDRDRVRHGDVAVEQVADALRDDRLAVAGRAVDEQRVAGVDGRPERIDHAIAEHEVPARLADPLARGAARHARPGAPSGRRRTAPAAPGRRRRSGSAAGTASPGPGRRRGCGTRRTTGRASTRSTTSTCRASRSSARAGSITGKRSPRRRPSSVPVRSPDRCSVFRTSCSTRSSDSPASASDSGAAGWPSTRTVSSASVPVTVRGADRPPPGRVIMIGRRRLVVRAEPRAALQQVEEADDDDGDPQATSAYSSRVLLWRATPRPCFPATAPPAPESARG